MEAKKVAAELARRVRAAVEVGRELAEIGSGMGQCPLCGVEFAGVRTHDAECLARKAAEAQAGANETELGELLDVFWVWLMGADQEAGESDEYEALREKVAGVLWEGGVDDGAEFADPKLAAIAGILRSDRDTFVPPAEDPPPCDQPAAG